MDLGYLEVGIDVRREGIEIGKEIGEDISVITDMCKTAKTYAPDYDEEKVCEAYLKKCKYHNEK